MEFLKLKKLIAKAEVVSFDIFDTLLLRTYAKPVDLFYHLEELFNAAGFAAKRIESENFVRSQKEEVTIYDIYSQMPEFSYMQEKEIEFEFKNLHQNKQMKQIYDYALKLNKKIVITSDMYLPYEVIEKLLLDNGFSKFHKIYLSNVYTKTKYTGKLFDCLIDDLKIKPAKILHIGDAYHNDYMVPIKKGIKTFHYKSVISRYLDKHPNFKKLYDNNKNYEISVMMMLSAQNELYSNNYWYNIGFSYGGAIASGYVDFIKTKAQQQNIKDILFIARDGYSLKRIFDLDPCDKTSHYVYAPRCFNQQKFETKVKEYLKSFNLSSDVAIIETLSGSFSAQNTIEKGLNQEVLGIYINLNRDAVFDISKNKYVFNEKLKQPLFSKWDFIEFLLTAPEVPVCDLNGNEPVYFKNPSKCEIFRKNIYPQISDGEFDFHNTLRQFFTREEISLSLNSVKEWINYFTNNPNKNDKKHFNKIFHAIDAEHKEYELLFKEWYEGEAHGAQKIFSIKNKYIHKIVTILGLKLKFKSKKLLKKHNVNKNSFLEDILSVRNVDKYRVLTVFGIKFKSLNKHKVLLDAFDDKISSLENKLDFISNKLDIISLNSKSSFDFLGGEINKLQTVCLETKDSIKTLDVDDIFKKNISTTLLHQRTFLPFKNKHKGQTVVLVAAGPTVNKFKKIDNAVYVGLNRAFRKNDVDFDYLFAIDKMGLKDCENEFANYRPDNCIKFVGYQGLGEHWQIPEDFANSFNCLRYKTVHGTEPEFMPDIDSYPLVNSCTVSIQAMQFILYTNPQKVYIVGIDCTMGHEKHFDGSDFDLSHRNENAKDNNQRQIDDWKRIKEFARIYYPETEIISINPVGLKGVFKDIYTEQPIALEK